MSPCFPLIINTKATKPPLIIVVLGIDNSGKSSIIMRLRNIQGQPTTGWGFSVSHIDFNATPESILQRHFNCFKRNSVPITCYDISGHAKIRSIWRNYIAEAHACVYVIDSSDAERFQEAKIALDEIYTNPLLHGKPLLILCNKQDKLNTELNSSNAFEKLKLSQIFPDTTAYSNEYNSKLPFRIQDCSSLIPFSKDNNSIDPRIKAGFRWLIERTENRLKELEKRVQVEVGTIQAKKILKTAPS